MKFYSDPRVSFKKPRVSKEEKKNLTVCRSKEFHEVMSSDRNPLFPTEEQENTIPPLSAEAKQLEAIEDFIHNMLTNRKYHQLPRLEQHRLVSYVSGNCMKENEMEAFIKRIRIPSSPIFDIFIEEMKKHEEDEDSEATMDAG